VSGKTSRLSPEEIRRRHAEGMAAYRARIRSKLLLPHEINMLLQQMQERGSAFVVFDRRKLIALFRGGGK
jgi:hypothetical protein